MHRLFGNSLFNTVPDILLAVRNKPHSNQLCANLSHLISANGFPLFYVLRGKQQLLNARRNQTSLSPVLLPYKFTLLSNYPKWVDTLSRVLLPYKFTLLSNPNLYGSRSKQVLLPYKFTLLSNCRGFPAVRSRVLLPYKFTLLSNRQDTTLFYHRVLLPYKFTLLSNA